MAMTTDERRAMLDATLDRYVIELAQGDIKPDYTINGQSVSWVEYRSALSQWIADTQILIDSLGDDSGGIVEEVTQYTT